MHGNMQCLTATADVPTLSILLDAHDEQVRGTIATRLPTGWVPEWDGPLLRVTTPMRGFGFARDLEALSVDDLDALIGRTRDFFAQRGESVEWKTYGHDRADLTERLSLAGGLHKPRWRGSAQYQLPLAGLRSSEEGDSGYWVCGCTTCGIRRRPGDCVGCECQDGSVDAGLRVDSDDVGRLRRALTDDIDAVVELLTRPFLWLVRTHCGLRRFYGLLGVLKRRGRRPSDRCKPTVGPVVLEPTTCGFDIPDSPSTRRAPRGSSGGYDSDRKPLSSANVPTKTPGGPRRARTDDLRIKGRCSGCQCSVPA